MKKILAMILATMVTITLFGCNKRSSITTVTTPNTEATEPAKLLREGKVISVSVSSSPGTTEYFFEGEDATAIVSYLSDLTLESNFEENPDEYDGMTWDILLEYEDGNQLMICHFGNMFICTEAGPWYKMDYEEASRLDSLLYELNN